MSRTLEERAHRLFQTKGVPLESLDSSLFAKSKSAQSRDPKKQKEIALLEAQVYRYTELLGVSWIGTHTHRVVHAHTHLHSV